MRPYIEVDTGGSTFTNEPISLFAQTLRLKEKSTTDVEEYNKRLLENLIRKNQIPRSSIVWHGEKIARIYGFKIDGSGKIEYNTEKKTSPKRVTHVHAVGTSELESSMLRDAIIRSKQMEI